MSALAPALLAAACSGDCPDGAEAAGAGRCLRWTPTARLPERAGPETFRALPDGRALALAGGTPYVLDPTAATWTTGPDAPFAPVDAAVLADGRVVAVGVVGQAAGYAEWWPGAKSWSAVHELPTYFARVVALPTEGALFLGADRDTSAPRAWRSDRNSAMTPTAAPAATWGALVPLADGSILKLSSAPERFDPASGTWTGGAPQPGGRGVTEALPLASGDVLVIDAPAPSASLTAEIYAPDDDAWRPAASPARGGDLAELPDGAVLATSGNSGALLHVYDPARDEWTITAAPFDGRTDRRILRLADGRVLEVHGRLAFLLDLVD